MTLLGAKGRFAVADTITMMRSQIITAKSLADVNESMFVNGFVEAWNARAESKVSIVRRLPPPAPDYLMSGPRGLFGLEVTELFDDDTRSQGSGSLERRVRGVHADQLTRLADAYYAAGGLPLRVNVLLLRIDDLSSLDEKQHPNLVALLIASRPSAGSAEATITGRHGEPLVRLYLLALPTDDRKFERYSWWQCVNDRLGLAGPMEPKVIERAIRAKAPKLGAYRKFAERIALLLVVNYPWRGGMSWWPADLVALDTAGFDDVYFYIYGDPSRTDPIKHFPAGPASDFTGQRP